MKIALALLLVAMLGEHLCNALPPTDSNCRWTGCEGKTYFGVDLCKQYGGRRYTGRVNYEGCSWDTSRVECCSPYPAGTVKWTKLCYGIAYGGDFVCDDEYGPGFRHAGGKKACDTFATYEFECKN